MPFVILTHSLVIFNLLLFAALVFFRRERGRSHIILALLMLIPVPFFITHLIFALYGYTPVTVQTIFISSSISPLFGPLILFYVNDITGVKNALPLQRFYKVSYTGIPLLFWIRYLLLNNDEKDQYVRDVIAATGWEFILFDALFIGSLFVCLLLSIRKLSAFRTEIKEKFSSELNNLKWIRDMVKIILALNTIGTLLLGSIWLFYPAYLLVAMNMVLAVNVCVFFSFIIYQAFGYHPFIAINNPPAVYNNLSLEDAPPDEDMISGNENAPIPRSYIDAVYFLMEEKKIYLEPALKVKDVAEQVQLPVHIVSRIFNQGFGRNFFDLLNEYRINHVCRLMQDKAKKHLTIEGLGFESGFNSKAAFFRAFKKYKDVTPHEYKERLDTVRGEG